MACRAYACGRHWRTTIADPTAAKASDLVERDFTAEGPNRLWVADVSYVRTQQGFRYLAGVLDVFSRRLVGWCLSERMTTPLVLSALDMGLLRGDVPRGQLTHHADHGSHYTSLAFSQRLADAGIGSRPGLWSGIAAIPVEPRVLLPLLQNGAQQRVMLRLSRVWWKLVSVAM